MARTAKDRREKVGKGRCEAYMDFKKMPLRILRRTPEYNRKGSFRDVT